MALYRLLACSAAALPALCALCALCNEVAHILQGVDARDPACIAPTNVLLVTVDDMNWDSVGAFGCPVPAATPNIDRLASEGILFQNAHVTVPVCKASRAALMTGLYPFRSGAFAFEPILPTVEETLPERLAAAGYLNGLLGKVPHTIPSRHDAFDLIVPARDLGFGRDPELYHELSAAFLERARAEERPFFLMANALDPHRPFSGQEKRGGRRPAIPPLAPRDVPVPGFLPDLPPVQEELAQYFTSVRRADSVVGAVLQALSESALESTTLVVFLSDHEMSMPFAKTNCYYHSTKTPLIIRWPGVVERGRIDREHYLASIDLAPTILDAIGLEPMKQVDGRSFASILRGGRQSGRDGVYTLHNGQGRHTYPMRAVFEGDLLYIFNSWSNGKRTFVNEVRASPTFEAMLEASRSDPEVAGRLRHLLFREPEELYDLSGDEDCLHSLVGDRDHIRDLRRLRARMHGRMQALGDPLLPEFANRTGLARPRCGALQTRSGQ